MDGTRMDEQQLRAVLEEIADESPVPAVPLDAITASPVRRRAWRTPVLAAAAGALVAGVGVPWGVGWWQDQNQMSLMPGNPTVTRGPDAVDSPNPLQVSPGARLVGIGEVAIEVPAGWGTNDTRCGTPQSNTVVTDSTDFCFAYFQRRAGVESIEVNPLQAVADLLGEPVREEKFLGVDATRWETTCSENDFWVKQLDSAPVTTCVAQVWLHGDDDVHFKATADTVERAEELLTTIRRTPGHVGVMGPNDFARYDLRMSEKSLDSVAEAYVDLLRGQGLEPSLNKDGARDKGRTVHVSPAAGTVLERGARVEVTIGVAAP